MKYLIIILPILVACSTVPSHELQDCQDDLVRFYKRHYQTPPYQDIKEICEREVSQRQLIERMSNRK